MTIVRDTFPATHEADYMIKMPRSDGERTLGVIALTSPREYLWTFDAQEQMWRHHLVPSKVIREYDGTQFIGTRMALDVPSNLLTPITTKSSLYHIHPTRAETLLPNLAVREHLPSNADIQTSAEACLMGYRDSRVVAELGVSTITFTPSVIKSRSITLKGFTIKNEEVDEWVEAEGTIATIKRVAGYYAANSDGLIQVAFNEFTSEESERL